MCVCTRGDLWGSDGPVPSSDINFLYESKGFEPPPAHLKSEISPSREEGHHIWCPSQHVMLETSAATYGGPFMPFNYHLRNQFIHCKNDKLIDLELNLFIKCLFVGWVKTTSPQSVDINHITLIYNYKEYWKELFVKNVNALLQQTDSCSCIYPQKKSVFVYLYC